MSIAKAAKTVGIPYDNAKAINRTYQREQRISKIDYKERYLARKTKDVEEMLSKSKAEASDHAIQGKVGQKDHLFEVQNVFI